MFNNTENLWADKSFTSIGYENGMMAGNADVNFIKFILVN